MTDAFPAIAAAIKQVLEGQGFTRLVGAEVVSIEPGVVVMALDRRPEVLQQNGLFHGGVIAYLIAWFIMPSARPALPVVPTTA